VENARFSFASPLRYPGGKTRLAPTVAAILDASGFGADVCFAEPFAGGAGVATSLLLAGRVAEIALNDADEAVAAFWSAALGETERFVDAIRTVPLDLGERARQARIYAERSERDAFELGFAFFYLNRTSRSGIATAGPIGGAAQAGADKIDARFNRETLVRRVVALAERRDAIRVSCADFATFLRSLRSETPDRRVVVFADPPYWTQGPRLYRRSFDASEHARLADALLNDVAAPWLLTYDDAPEIRALYPGVEARPLSASYCAARRKTGAEVLFQQTAEATFRRTRMGNEKIGKALEESAERGGVQRKETV